MSIALSPFLHVSQCSGSDTGLTLKHWCPGCKRHHLINVEKPNHCNAVWSWDQNSVCPTLSPSVNVSSYDDEDGTTYRCHYFLRDGTLEFLSDSTHELSGKTVSLPRIPVLPEDLEYLMDLDFSS